MKICTIVGALTQFIKSVPVTSAIAATGDATEVLVHTGQHYDDNMSSVFFSELGIREPTYNLGIGSLPHGAQTGRMLEQLEDVLFEEQPDWVVVYGDTNSTLAGALAAVKMHIPVAHIEAGLRSFNRDMPEEINRILTDHAADLLFTPTSSATAHLQGEGVATSRIVQVGDVMYDAALHFSDRAEDQCDILGSPRFRTRGLSSGNAPPFGEHRRSRSAGWSIGRPSRSGCGDSGCDTSPSENESSDRTRRDRYRDCRSDSD